MKVLKIAIRSLMHFKWYTAINIVGLALSLACVIVIFRYVYGEITVDRYIPDLDRVYVPYTEFADAREKPHLIYTNFSERDEKFKDIRRSPAVEIWTQFLKSEGESINVGEQTHVVTLLAADSNFNKIFELPIISGVLNLSDPDAAAISTSLAAKLFGAEDPLGKVINLHSGIRSTVTAVFGETSTRSSLNFDMMLSNHHSEQFMRAPVTVIKLYPNHNYKEINEQYSEYLNYSSRMELSARNQLHPYKDIYLNSSHLENFFFERGNRIHVFMLFGAGILILLVGAANFINIYLAVAMRRGREWGMKKVFGARGPQIFTQIWVENTLLVGMSLLIALSITEMISPLVKNHLGLQQIPFVAFDFSLVGIFFVTLPLLTTIIPFIKYNYSMPANSLRSIGTTGGRGTARKIFLTLQYTITIFLIIVSTLFDKQLYSMLNLEPGFRTKDVVYVPNYFRITRGDQQEGKWEVFLKKVNYGMDVLEQRMKASTTIGNYTFGEHPLHHTEIIKFSFGDGEYRSLILKAADQEWMDLFEIELIDGRLFDDDIDIEEAYELIVSESVLRQFGIEDWRNANLQSEKRLWHNLWDDSKAEEMQTNPPYRIIGVVKDFNGFYLGDYYYPSVFIYKQGNIFRSFLVSFDGGHKREAIEFLRQLHDETVGGEFVYSFIEDDMRALYDEDRKVATVFTIFTMIAILISVMGLFSMSLFDIEQRYNEIAIRKVNGATTGQIISMLLRKYVILLGIAFLIAAPAAWFVLTKYLENFAFKTPISWWIFALALLVTAGVSLLTLIVQTKKAAETNPASVIRNE